MDPDLAAWSTVFASSSTGPEDGSDPGQTPQAGPPPETVGSTEANASSSAGVSGTAFFTVTGSPVHHRGRRGRKNRFLVNLVEGFSGRTPEISTMSVAPLQPPIESQADSLKPMPTPEPLRVQPSQPIFKRPKLSRMGDCSLGTHLPHALALASSPGSLLDMDVATIAKPALLLYIDNAAYDETPLKVNIRQTLLEQQEATEASGADFAVASSSSRSVAARLEIVITKVLQSKSRYGLMLNTVQGLVGLVGQSFSPLQSMSKGNHLVLKECLARVCAVSHAAESFQHKLRSVCSDQAGCNRLGEEGLLQDRPCWHGTHLPCDVHCLAACHQKSFDSLLPKDVAGMLHTALSLRFWNSWSLFRSSLQVEVESRLQILPGHCAAEALAHSLIYGNTGAGLVTMANLLEHANGDWRNKGQVEYYYDPLKQDRPTPKRPPASLCVALCKQSSAASPSSAPGVVGQDSKRQLEIWQSLTPSTGFSSQHTAAS